MVVLIIMSESKINQKTESSYLSLHKFLANYKPKVINDEESALKLHNGSVDSIICAGIYKEIINKISI